MLSFLSPTNSGFLWRDKRVVKAVVLPGCIVHQSVVVLYTFGDELIIVFDFFFDLEEIVEYSRC